MKLHTDTGVDPFFVKTYKEWVRDWTGFGSPLVLGFVASIIYNISTVQYWILIATWGFNEVFLSFIKLIFFKNRPRAEKYTTVLSKIAASSFPSIHASRLAVLLGYSINTGIRADILIMLAVAVIIVGWTRVVIRKHDWIDVTVGWVFGLALGYAVQRLF
jgi:membrane-associated phospholipid phosphatase